MFKLRIKDRISNGIHNWLIKKLIEGDSTLTARDINKEKRTIFLGMWGMSMVFMEPKHKVILAILVKYYKYKCTEMKLEVRTWKY